MVFTVKSLPARMNLIHHRSRRPSLLHFYSVFCGCERFDGAKITGYSSSSSAYRSVIKVNMLVVYQAVHTGTR